MPGSHAPPLYFVTHTEVTSGKYLVSVERREYRRVSHSCSYPSTITEQTPIFRSWTSGVKQRRIRRAQIFFQRSFSAKLEWAEISQLYISNATLLLVI